ncbi:MAG: fructose 1,6-bisphosphatase [Deltaproteobacteria bacterium]|nr:fructose 1,6-bisphosphatase [Deltaproteobacteria bacterium]
MTVEKLFLTVFKVPTGGFVGHTSGHPEILDIAKTRLINAKEKGAILGWHALRCGDDLGIIISHRKDAHELIWNVFGSCAETSASLKLYGADTLLERFRNSAFPCDLGQMGIGVAQIEFVERQSEPFCIFMADKAMCGAFNLPLYRIFADPFNTNGLLKDPLMTEGFTFTVIDRNEKKSADFRLPQDTYDCLSVIGKTERYSVVKVTRNSDALVSAVTSAPTENDPILIIRCEDGLPAAGETIEPFAYPCLVRGYMRGAGNSPLMPVPFYESNPVRADGPPRLIAAGFQLANGRLIGPHDMFDDPGFDNARQKALRINDYLGLHGGAHLNNGQIRGSVKKRFV